MFFAVYRKRKEPPCVEVVMLEEGVNMNGSERQVLRLELLQGLYNHHFSNNGDEMRLNSDEIDTETKLAYEYLKEKNLISIKHFGGRSWEYKITAYGVDAVESIKQPLL